ncbi:MAG: terminase large subunit [Gammaproteobacteria bacterium]
MARDYVRIATSYAQAAVKDRYRKRHGHLIRLAAKRFLADLKKAKRKNSDFIFDRWHANDACDFIEKLPHVEGTWETPTIKLHRSHVFFVVQLFGFRKRESVDLPTWSGFHPRRFTSALFAVARKNAKSTLAAGIMLYCECCEPEEGAQIISAATTFSQASIIFKIAKRMVEKTPDLRDAFGLEVWAPSITRLETGTSFKPVHAKASTQDGLNPSHVSLDEIHAHKNSDLLNVLKSAAGARLNPLWLYTTTEGYLNPGPWQELRLYARKLLQGLFGSEGDYFLAVIYAVDEESKAHRIKADNDFDENAWRKANPLMDVNPQLLVEIRKHATEAKQMPSVMSEFRIKRLNRQSSTQDGWIDLPKFQKCNGEVNLKKLKDVPCWGGLDLASVSDIAVFRLSWELDGVVYTKGWRWVPESAVATRTERGTVPYESWCESGLLKQTEGDSIDYDVIFQDIIKIIDGINLQVIAYDRWNATDIVSRLVLKGIPMIEFVQGHKSYHPAMKALEKKYIDGNLAHGGDPVLEWCASNLISRKDVNLNDAPDKRKSADKIDDIVALIMSIGVMLTRKAKKKSIYAEGTI